MKHKCFRTNYFFIFLNKGTTFNPEANEFDDTIKTKSIYEKAEQEYTTRSYRYVISWFGIVCLYALILLIVPVNDVLQGQMNANNWTTLFKTMYVKNHNNI